MSVPLTGSGGYWARIGRLIGGLQDVVALKGGAATARVLSGASFATRGTNIEADAAASPAVSDQIDGHWTSIHSWRASQQGLFTAMKAIAEKITIRMVDLDAPLASKDLASALKELARQMEASSDSLNQSTVAAGAQTAVGAPTGNPIFVLSLKNNRGYALQTPFAEALRFEMTADSQGSATARSEPYTVKGAAPVSDPFSHLWPGGSGCSISTNLCDAQRDNSGAVKNYCTNGDFETFTTANYPDNWVAEVGTVGTHIASVGAGYTQSNAVKFIGDGSNLTSLTQELNKAASTTAGAGGTPAKLEPSTTYALNFFNKVGSVPAAGVLRAALVNGDTGAVINDDSGAANSYTTSLPGLTTSYAANNGTFRTPTVLPSKIKLQLKLTTALSNTVELHIDDLALTKMTQLYSGGPFVAGFAGATLAARGDKWTRAVTNTMGVLAMWAERLFSLRDKGVQFPFSGAPTVADSLAA